MRQTITLLALLTFSFVSAQQDNSQNSGVATMSTTVQDAPQKRQMFMINFSGGLSYRLAKSPSGLTSEENDYYKNLKSGISYDAGAYYFADERRGYGLRYNVHKSSASIANQELLDPNGETGVGTASDDITITFIGPAAMLRERGFLPNDHVSLEVALGYMGYVNETKILNNYTIKGGNLGIIAGGGYQFGIGENFSVGPAISLIGGVLSKLKIEGKNFNRTIKLEDEQRENLYRLDLSVSARLKF